MSQVRFSPPPRPSPRLSASAAPTRRRAPDRHQGPGLPDGSRGVRGWSSLGLGALVVANRAAALPPPAGWPGTSMVAGGVPASPCSYAAVAALYSRSSDDS
ncbi:MAG TPA: hypothetical protein VFH51_16680, partial [Myxococcota bacterium]|nr:hypothetical protein [Myxococcota bacterium]